MTTNCPVAKKMYDVRKTPTRFLQYLDAHSACILNRYNYRTVGDLLDLYNSRPHEFFNRICSILENFGSSLSLHILEELDEINDEILNLSTEPKHSEKSVEV